MKTLNIAFRIIGILIPVLILTTGFSQVITDKWGVFSIFVSGYLIGSAIETFNQEKEKNDAHTN